MNWKLFGKKLELAGAYLSGVTGGSVVLTMGIPDSLQHTVSAWCLMGGFGATVAGRLIQIFADDDGILDDVKRIAALAVVAGMLVFGGWSCTAKTKAVSQAEVAQSAAYEQALKNENASYEKMKGANLVNYTKKKDLELKLDLQALDVQSKLNAVLWTPAAIAAESARLHSVHDTAIAAYKERIAAADAVRAKNQAVNVGTARKIGEALNPPKTAGPLIDQSGEIEAQGGPAPVPAPLIEK